MHDIKAAVRDGHIHDVLDRVWKYSRIPSVWHRGTQQVSENMHLPIIFHSIIKRLKDLAFCIIICPVTGFLSEFTTVNTPI